MSQEDEMTLTMRAKRLLIGAVVDEGEVVISVVVVVVVVVVVDEGVMAIMKICPDLVTLDSGIR